VRLPNLAYGVFATSPIANSRILALDTAAAERAPSVVLVMTPRNAPKLERLEAPAAVIHLPLQDERITYVRCVCLRRTWCAATGVLGRIWFTPERQLRSSPDHQRRVVG
jgi:hypothetical protein